MGGHGGLNILPQKKWNVYNYDNRDIVDKDKKEHAQKMQKSYESDRKHTMHRKFDVLKGDNSANQKNEQKIKQSYKKDSILNHQFKRMAEQNQHVNLFQHQQKIIQNRQVLEYHKMKQAQWLKNKDLDYSSKFLGTYNDDGKTPWYAKSKGVSVSGNDGKRGKNINRLDKQRYDMEDLTDLARLEKLASRKQYYLQQKVKQRQNVQKQTIEQERIVTIKRQQLLSEKVKRESFSDQRQRSRHRKYEFIKQRETLEQTGAIGFKQSVHNSINNNNKPSCQSKNSQQKQLENKSPQRQIIDPSSNMQQQPQNTNQLQLLRLKRLKRQQKQRRKAQQLRKKIQQSINQN